MLLFGRQDIHQGLEAYKTTPNALLVDVRETDAFASGHIPGAVNAPLSTIAQAKLDKNKVLFLYCLRGSRSKQAEGILKRMGYNSKSIGGINGYKGDFER